MVRLMRRAERIAPAPRRIAARGKKALPFYQSAEWKMLVAQRRRDPDYALAKARAKDGEWLVLDHVVEIRDGGARLDPGNTQWLTHSEHQAKTARSKRARVGLERRGGVVKSLEGEGR